MVLNEDEGVKLEYEDVSYAMAVPAKRREILLWLLTWGRRGKLFTRKVTAFRQWHGPGDSINCRCTVVKTGLP